MKKLCASALLLLNCILSCGCFNIEVKQSPQRFSGVKGEYFGYAITIHRANDTYWAIVGAPLSNFTGKRTQEKNGAVYRCHLNGNSGCINMGIDDYPPTIYQGKTGQWMGASVVSFGHNQDIVACAPRFKDITTGGAVRLIGRCGFVEGRKFEHGTSFWNSFIKSSYRYCQAGFSVAATTFGAKKFISGAPRNQGSKGSVFVQPFSVGLDGISHLGSITETEDRTLELGGMLGYAVAWGKFSKSSTYGEFVGGAPQGNIGKGRVIIYKLRDGQSRIQHNAIIENPDDTMSIGSYFGSVVCAVDLTKDGLSDLIVGAPLYSVVSDEGKAYIFVTDAKGEVNFKRAITGESTVNGRFGSSIASAGDLNDDGYNDVIIGAPYGGPDGKGAVYVYHGSENGLGNNFQPVQKIYASSLSGTQATFGHSLAGSVDVDNNQYPDIVVGSYQSDQVHVFKTKPVLKIKADLQLSNTKISLSSNTSIACKTDGAGNKYQCSNMTLCISYSGKGVPSQLELAVNVEFDKDQLAGKRAVWFDGPTAKTVKRIFSQYEANKRKCHLETVYIKENVLNLLSPIVITASYSYTELAGGCGVTPCPVADMYSPKSVSIQATYLKDCGGDDVCQADLVVSAKSKLPSGKTALVFGLEDTLTLEIDVVNKGENAFLSKMKINFPDDLYAIGMQFVNEQSPLLERPKSKNGTSQISFDLDSPVIWNQKFKILVKFTQVKPRPTKGTITFNIEATSVSNEVNPIDNKAVVTVQARLLADLTVSGSASPDKLFYEPTPREVTDKIVNETQVGPVINYIFTIQNRGPSPVQGLYARVSLLAQHNSKWLLNLFSISIDGSVKCDLGSKLNPKNLTTLEQASSQSRQRRDAKVTEKASLSKLDCLTATCITFDCYIGSLKKGDSRTLKLRTRLFQNTFIEEKRGTTKLTSVISVEIPGEEKANLKQPANGLPDKADVSVSISPPIKTTNKEAKPIAWWIILLSVLGAILLITVFVLTLWKLGFFERKLKGKTITGPVDQDDDGDEY